MRGCPRSSSRLAAAMISMRRTSTAALPRPGFSTPARRSWIGAAHPGGPRSLIHGAGSTLVQRDRPRWTCRAHRRRTSSERLRPWRRQAAYLVIAIALCATVVSILKFATNMDCPRDIAGLGGINPYVHLFEDRPDAPAARRLLPGSRASTGFTADGVLFPAAGHRGPGWRRVLLAVADCPRDGLFPGAAGAGAPTSCPHDLTECRALAWFLLLGLWRLLLRSPAIAAARIDARGSGTVQPLDTQRATRSGT